MRSVKCVRCIASVAAVAALFSSACYAAPAPEASDAQLDELTAKELPKVIAWRRDLHQHPELGNRETRTAKLIAEHLKRLGLKVQTGVAHTGVLGLLEGGRPGPTVAVRADIDALPVTEKTDVPFRSHVTTTYRGETVGVMHACGHDAHTAMLMGLAEELTRVRASLPGKVLFIFQPAEEGAPEGEEGGAQLILKQGLFAHYQPQVVFGMHVWAALALGDIGYRSGALMAGVDSFKVHVQGRQAHGSRPWQSIDPVVTSAQIVNALQTVVSRDVDITAAPAVVSVGAIKGGIRSNIIPSEVDMLGTIRTFTAPQRDTVLSSMKRIIENTAAANGATAQFILGPEHYPVTYNDPKLMAEVLPSLQAVAGAEHVKQMDLITAAEDFSFFAQTVPGVYFFVGVTPPEQDPASAPSNHSDYFYLDERGIPIGMRAMAHVVIDYLNAHQGSS